MKITKNVTEQTALKVVRTSSSKSDALKVAELQVPASIACQSAIFDVGEIIRLVHGNGIPMGIPWETSHGMGWNRHKLLWDGNGTDKDVPWTTLGLSMGMAFLWQSHGKRPMGWDEMGQA